MTVYRVILRDTNATRCFISPQRAASRHGGARRLLRRWVGPGQRPGSDRLIVPVLLWLGEKNRQIPAEGRQNATQTDVTGCPEPTLPPLTSRLGQQICLIVSYIGSGKPIAVPNNRQDIYGRLHDRKGDDTTDVTQLSKCSRLRRQVC